MLGKKACFRLTILILEKLTSPSSVKFGVPSSINAKSVRYMPKYGTHGGLQLWGMNKKIIHYSRDIIAYRKNPIQYKLRAYFFRVSLRFLNLPSEDTVFCSLSISALV